MKGMYAGIPLVVGLLGALMMSRFTFNEAEHARVRADLASRAEAEGR